LAPRIRSRAAIAVFLLVGGCTTITQGDGTTFCGAHIPTGAEGMTFEPLDQAVPAPPGAAPKASVLPRQQSGATTYGLAYFIRTSPDCAHGSVVEVLPASDTTLATTVPSDDGGIAGIIIWPTAKLTVYAWTGGTYQGGMTVRPR
jgi:hypothetical protein